VRRTTLDGLRAGLVGGLFSGLPSTIYALVRRDDPLEATRAVGTVLLRSESRTAPLLAAAFPVHFALSLGWGVVLARMLPRRATVAWGAAAGVALRMGPQVADHAMFGALVGATLAPRAATIPRHRRKPRAAS
jgi:hypothetical protein